MAFTFGQQSTPGFGSSTPAFGATSTPAFGQTGAQFGASSAAFSFASSTPAFGPASTPAFGATSTPAFGAASQPFGTPAIGATSAATPFGANTTPTFGASSPSLFGASSASLFGASSTPAFGASSPAPLFGAASTGAFGASTGGGLFGAATSAPFNFASSSGSMFGASTSTATNFGITTQMAPAAYSTGPTTDPAVKELSEIAAAYNPTSSSFRFTALLLNVVENPAQRIKPAGVDELRWRQAMKEAGGENNPNKLWPVVARGFKDLAARGAEQDRALQENKARIEQLRGVGHQLARRQEDALRERVVGLQRQQEQLLQRLLRVWRHVDAAEARLGTVLGYRRDPAKEQQLLQHLRALEGEVAPHSAGGLQRRLEALTAAARLSGGIAAGGAGGEELSQESQAKLFAVLKDHSEAIQRLQAVLQQDVGDLEVLKGELGAEDVAMAMVPAGGR